MSLRTHLSLVVLTTVVFVSIASHSSTRSARDPDFGEPLSGLTRDEEARFRAGLEAFVQEEGLSDGLGPIFNDVGCAACHSIPAVGGAGITNETRAALVEGRRYVELPGGSLFQSNALQPDCMESVPAEANVRTERQTQPLFGLGLVEAIPDRQIEAYQARQRRFAPRQAGTVHRVTDVTTGQHRVGRFGWKAQQPTLLAFSGDAYLNEMGITSAFFPRENAPNGDEARLRACDVVPDPEDDGEDIEAFADFMRLLAPPPRRLVSPGPRVSPGRRVRHAGAPNAGAGERVFGQIGCAVCHSNVYTARSPIRAIDGQHVQAFSDFLLHDVGTGDGIVQGRARGTDFRTAPLWGLSSSAPYLHDGRAATVTEAIRWHRNQGASASRAFDALPDSSREALLEFLGSL